MRLLLSILLCIYCGASCAQSAAGLPSALRLPVRAFTADDGLGGATITSVTKDPRGFLWIGTPDELLLWDGRRFTPFRYTDTLRVAKSFRRSIILRAGDDHFLILHEGGAHAWSQRRGRLQRLVLPFTFADITHRVTLTPDTDGWYRLSDMKLTARYHPQSGRCELLKRHDPPHIALRRTTATGTELLDCDTMRDGRGFRGARTGTGEHVGDYKVPFRVLSAVLLKDGMVLLDDARTQHLWWMPHGNTPKPFATLRAGASELRAFPAGNAFFLAAGANLLRFRPATGDAEEVADEEGRPLPGTGVITHLLQEGRTLWVGTNAVGLLRVSLEGKRFGLVKSPVDAYNFTHALYPDLKRGRLYVGTYSGEVVVWDTAGAFRENLTPVLRRAGGLPSAYLNAIEPLPDGSLFIISGHNFWVFNPATRTVVNLIRSADEAARTAGLDPENFIGRKGVARIGPWEWWMTDRAGLVRWRLVPAAAGRSARLQPEQIIRLPGKPPEAIAPYAGMWWCATSGTLYCVDSGGVRGQYSLPLTAFATSMAGDKSGRLWIATESGIVVWRGGKAERIITTESGLPNNHIYALQPDSAGWMWGSSNGGLFAVRTSDFFVRAFTAGDGLQGAEFNLGASARDAAGRLYFGGMNGVNVFHPAAALRDEAVNKVTITRVAAPDTVYYTYPGPLLLPRLRLPYDRASVHLSYTAPQPASASPQQYEYRLGDADSAWTEGGKDGELQLRLAPGDYHIVVRLRGAPASAAELWVAVSPPFYRTEWFLLLAVFFCGAAVAAIVVASARARYRRRLAVLETAQRIQEEKERISRELHDELGARAALIAHNAGQLSDAARNHGDTAPLASRITETTADMLTALRETVWTLNQETVSAESLWLRYKNFVVKLGATYTHLRFAVEERGALPTAPLHYSHALNVLRILQEATMNAVKHSGASVITATAKAGPESLTFSIADDGCGFDVAGAQAAGEGAGLHNMAQRSIEAGLLLSIRRGDNAGTVVEVVMR